MNSIICSINVSGKEIFRGIEEVEISSSILLPITVAEIKLVLIDNLSVADFKKGNELIINYGLDNNFSKIKTTIINAIQTEGNKIKLFLQSAGAEIFTARITESYNNESSVAIIKRLVGSINLQINKIQIADINLSNIVFNNMIIRHAIDRVVYSIMDLTKKAIYYFIDSEGRFMMLTSPVEKSAIKFTFKSGENIISHKSVLAENCSMVRTGINPKLNITDTINIIDSKKNINEITTIKSINHSIIKGSPRSEVYY